MLSLEEMAISKKDLENSRIYLQFESDLIRKDRDIALRMIANGNILLNRVNERSRENRVLDSTIKRIITEHQSMSDDELIDVENLTDLTYEKYPKKLSKSQTFHFGREHFIERLKERYNITISKSEFNKYTRKEIILFYPITANKRFGKLHINNKTVWVIRDNDTSCLLTCLDTSGYFPIPKYYRDCRITNEVFKDTFNMKVDLGRKVAKWLFENNDNKAKLYLENPFNFTKEILGHGVKIRKNIDPLCVSKEWMDKLFNSPYSKNNFPILEESL